MADLQRTVSIIFEGEDRVTVKADGITKSFQSIETEAAEAGASVGRANDELDKTGDTALSVDKATTALKALAASLVVKDFIDANVAAEQFRKQLEFATGSAERAALEFEYVRQVSNRLGIEARGTADAYAKFSAAVKGTALEGEGARVIFEGFAGTLSQTGASSADINGAFVQLAQGISKGKFELEDLKSIAERVPGFFNAFADALGITTGELFSMVSAGEITGDEILRLANKFNIALQDANFDGFTNAFARLRNAIDDAYLQLGDAGVFDVLIKGLQTGTAAVTGALAAFTLLGETVGNLIFTITSGDFAGFGDRFDESLTKAADKTRAASDALLGVSEATKQVGFDAVEAGQKLVAGMEDSANAAEAAGNPVADLDRQLKALGIDPKKIKDPLLDVVAIFEELSANPAVTGEQILAGLVATLKQLKTDDGDIAELGAALSQAFQEGKLSADQFAFGADQLGEAAARLAKQLPGTTAEAKKLADEQKRAEETARKAEEAAREYALELEKIASNERIANIEARVSLNIAQLEADTARVKAAFESIDNTVNSTGDLLGDLFGLLTQFDDLSFGAIRLIQDQIDAENRRRDEALALQSKLTEAQIENIRAQTKALDRGDALIQIDGAGLQPHLEAFMFEILNAIQVRVNSEGLGFLLGTPTP